MASPNLQRPKVLSSIHEKRIVSRDHLRAVVNVLQHVGLELDQTFGPNMLKAVAPACEARFVHRIGNECLGYIADKRTGQARWDYAVNPSDHERLILSPDEGGPLFCAYVHLANSGSAIHFQRDELQL